MRYPDFICLGAQKAATTWLDDMLRRRADVFLPPVKELHYYSQLYNADARSYGPEHRKTQAENLITYIDGLPAPTPQQRARQAQARHLARAGVDDAWYGQIFAPARPDQLCAEICPSYMNMPDQAVTHMLRLNPDVRLLTLIRDPVDRAWSHIRMHMTREIETRETDRLVSGEASLWAYLFYTDYAAALPRWQAQTAPDQMLLILHDRIASEPQTVLEEIYGFVGLSLSDQAVKLRGKVHTGEEIEMPPALRAKLLEALTPQYDFLRPIFPEAVADWLAGHRDQLRHSPG